MLFGSSSSAMDFHSPDGDGPSDITELPHVVDVPDQPCQQLYEGNPVLLGFDVVQYHFIPSYRDGGRAVRGKPEFAYNFQGYQFWFSTKENRNLFITDPWKYAPAWGGFCSWGIARELPPRWPWEIDYLGPPASPWEGWLVVDGVLMFNIWAGYSDLFLEDRDENMRKAADRWKSFWGGEIEAGPFNTHCIGHGHLKNWCLSQQPSPWLKPLPSCNVTASQGQRETTDNNGGQDPAAAFLDDCIEQVHTGDTIDDECHSLIDVQGGGTVSDSNDFNDFSNQSISPYAKRAIRIGIVVGGVAIPVLLLVLCFLSRRCLPCYKTKKTPSPVESAIVASKEPSEGTDSFDDMEEPS